MIRVLLLPVGEAARVVEIDPAKTLAGLQALVKGRIEPIDVAPGVSVYCNEEFHTLGMMPNRLVGQSPLGGPLVVARYDAQGRTASLTDADIARYRDAFPRATHVRNADGSIHTVV